MAAPRCQPAPVNDFLALVLTPHPSWEAEVEWAGEGMEGGPKMGESSGWVEGMMSREPSSPVTEGGTHWAGWLARLCQESPPQTVSAYTPRATRFWGCWVSSASQRPGEQGRTGIIPHRFTDGETRAAVMIVMTSSPPSSLSPWSSSWRPPFVGACHAPGNELDALHGLLSKHQLCEGRNIIPNL